ncbi:MAG: PEGA domain-containing protein [Bacteroides sp.]
MLRRICTSFLILLGTFISMGFAQELKVKSFVQVPEDIIARTYPRNDMNDNLCAVIRVGIGLQGVKFSGNVIGEPIYEPGEYIVYVPEGNTKIKVLHADYIPLTVRFADYGIRRLESGCTYHLTILSEGSTQGSLPKVQGNFLIMNITPKQARVAINGGDPVASNPDGVFKTFLKPGSYTYSVETEGYDSKSGSFEMAGERITMPITLRSFKAAVTIKSTTSGASIYVNEEFKGFTSWEGTLNPGTYLVEARMDGHHPVKHTVTLSKQEERSFTLPALQPIYGSLMVDYEPMDADVYVDGKLLGKSPNLFSQVLVGTHEIKVVKEGYSTHTEKITIHENQQGSISGKLTLRNKVGSFASNASESIPGPEKEEFKVKGVKFNMIRVEGGTFTMGAPTETDTPSEEKKPASKVTVNTFYIGETEVTQALWKAVMGKSMRDYRAKVHYLDTYGHYCPVKVDKSVFEIIEI